MSFAREYGVRDRLERHWRSCRGHRRRSGRLRAHRAQGHAHRRPRAGGEGATERRARRSCLEAYMLDELGAPSDLRCRACMSPKQIFSSWISSTTMAGPSRRPWSACRRADRASACDARPNFGYERDTLIARCRSQTQSQMVGCPSPRAAVARHGADAAPRPSAVDMLSRIERPRNVSTTICSACASEPAARRSLDGKCARPGPDRRLRDPAIYFGHPESSLPSPPCSGTFGPAFFDAYGALLPAGARIPRAALGPLQTSTHARACQVFGAGYLSGIDRTLSRLGFLVPQQSQKPVMAGLVPASTSCHCPARPGNPVIAAMGTTKDGGYWIPAFAGMDRKRDARPPGRA